VPCKGISAGAMYDGDQSRAVTRANNCAHPSRSASAWMLAPFRALDQVVGGFFSHQT
jgi:hypothetical protein